MSDHEHLRLEALLDGELTDSEIARAEAHIAACETCRRAVMESRTLAEALAEPLPALPAGFAARTRERARARRLPEAPLWWLTLPTPWRLGLAALLVVAAGAGARLGREVTTDRAAATELAAALDAPATQALLAVPAEDSQAKEVR